MRRFLMATLKELTDRFPFEGRVEAVYLRPAREVAVVSVQRANALAGRGLEGDRSAQGPAGRTMTHHKRQVTLFQAEHLPLLASWLGRPSLDARVLRRNIVISGFNLLSAKGLFADQALRLRIGVAVSLRASGPCDPCSKMEVALGPGTYNAMRGHGGLTATVEVGGEIAVGDRVWVESVPAKAAPTIDAEDDGGAAPA